MPTNHGSVKTIPGTGRAIAQPMPRVGVNQQDVPRASPWPPRADKGLDILGAIIRVVVVSIVVGLGLWMWAVPTSRVLPILVWDLLRDSCLVMLALARMMRSLASAALMAARVVMPVVRWLVICCIHLLASLWTAFSSFVQGA
ncbi:hypothetical protein GY45DRAFT_1321893 [Cubamyces sp. BRFM 1775]|nr:hypothetical protein GY45DRAFT_1321893 [Cubamyces sp. BRFM 1775]